MKRDWDLLRKQLIAIEEEYDPLFEISDKSKWANEMEREKEEVRQLGHLKLLIDNRLIEGIFIMKNMNGQLHCGRANPQLTMSGHDLLDTLRTPKLWEKIKSLAKSKGLELSFDAIKFLGKQALENLLT